MRGSDWRWTAMPGQPEPAPLRNPGQPDWQAAGGEVLGAGRLIDLSQL